jgi:hypothetical protein
MELQNYGLAEEWKQHRKTKTLRTELLEQVSNHIQTENRTDLYIAVNR